MGMQCLIGGTIRKQYFNIGFVELMFRVLHFRGFLTKVLTKMVGG
jgi:hypothetical protein